MKEATKLQKARQAKGLTQKQLAEAAELSIRTLQHYEQGSKDINAAAVITVYKLAAALDVKIEEIINIPEDENDENLKKD